MPRNETARPLHSGLPNPLAPLDQLPPQPLTLRALWCRLTLLRWTVLALLLALVPLLSACGTTRPPPLATAPPPVRLVQPCPPPAPISAGTSAEVLSAWVEAMRLYSRCARDKDDLVRWIETQR